jgi:chromosomal replication initiator protein
MEKVWNQVKLTLKERVTESSYRMWIDPVAFLREEQDAVFLSTPNIFTKKRLQDHFAVLIQDELQSKLGKPCRIVFEIVNMPAGNVSRSDPSESQLVLPGVENVNTTGRMLRNDFTFDEFVVGSNNDFAFSASLAMATRKKAHSENALLLIAKTGLGKSHLTQAVGNHILQERPQERVYYISAEDFSNEMVYAMRNDCVDQFKKKYRTGCDVLLLDDIHYLTGKERTQIELAMALDSLMNSGKRIIFSSCCLPMEIPKLNDTLRSRLSSSIISPIDPPNFRTRVRILHKKAATRGLWVSEDVTRYLASELTEDIRQLESGLSGVAARASLMGTKIDMQLAENVIKNIVRQQKKITIDIIKKLVCAEFNVSMQDLLSPSRKQAIVRPRQIAMYLSRRYTDSPLQTIGKSFNRYHATAMHAIALVEKNLKENRGLFKQVELIGHKLETGDF